MCLKINRYSHERQGKEGNLPTVCRWLVLQQLDIDCQVTWLPVSLAGPGNLGDRFPRVYTEDAPVTLWCPLTDGTPCRCSWHATQTFGRRSDCPWTTLLSMRLDGLPPSPYALYLSSISVPPKCDPHWKPTALLLVMSRGITILWTEPERPGTPTWSSQGPVSHGNRELHPGVSSPAKELTLSTMSLHPLSLKEERRRVMLFRWDWHALAHGVLMKMNAKPRLRNLPSTLPESNQETHV